MADLKLDGAQIPSKVLVLEMNIRIGPSLHAIRIILHNAKRLCQNSEAFPFLSIILLYRDTNMLNK